jgi:hypothetical protein
MQTISNDGQIVKKARHGEPAINTVKAGLIDLRIQILIGVNPEFFQLTAKYTAYLEFKK